jgi:CRP-like cAMP-binding protein
MDQIPFEKIKKFFQSFPLQKFKKGETIIRSGDQFQKIYLIKNGFVRLYILSSNGKEVSLYLYGSGYYFPTMMGLLNNESEYYFEAVSPVSVYASAKDKFIDFIRNDPEMLFDLSKRSGNMVRGLLRQIEVFSTESPYKCTISTLIYMNQLYSDADPQKSAIITIPISHNGLATWTHTSRETVSRQIELLSRKKLIRCLKCKIQIINLQKLKNELDSGPESPQL